MSIKADLTITKNDILKYGFHYTKVKSLEKILKTRQFRFSPITKQMDLRERIESYNTFLISGEVGSKNEVDRINEYSRAKELRSKVKLACFSLDSNGEVHNNSFYKGWANMKMWEDYGECNKGACLVFDIQDFIYEIKKQMPDFDFRCKRIEYTNDIIDEQYWIPEITEKNQNRKVEKDIFCGDDYLFRKVSCYNFENEYRFLLMKESESRKSDLDVDYGNSIKAIILGVEIPKRRIQKIKRMAKEIPIFQMRLYFGIPELEKL